MSEIYVTSITPPEQGWPIATYCPLCKETTFILSPWAIKPERGDYWLMKDTCSSDTVGNTHNMKIACDHFGFGYKPLGKESYEGIHG